MVKTRSNSSNTALNGERPSHENMNSDTTEMAKMANTLQQQSNKIMQSESIVSSLQTSKEEKTLIVLDVSSSLRNQISKNELDAVVPCTSENHRNRLSHKRVSKNHSRDGKQLPSSTITSTDLKSASDQGYCPGNIAEVVRRQVSPSVSITPTVAAGPSSSKRQYGHHRIPNQLISATDVIDKHHQRQLKLRRRKSMELFQSCLDEADMILNTANMTEEQILEEMRRRNKEDAAKCRELMRKIQSRSQAVTMTAAERLSKNGLLVKGGKVSKYHASGRINGQQLFRRRSSIEAPQEFIEETDVKAVQLKHEQPGSSSASANSKNKFQRASTLTHQKYMTATRRASKSYNEELSNRAINQSTSILSNSLTSSLSNEHHQITADDMTDKAGSSYSGWCRKRNHTTGEMQLVRKHSEYASKLKRQRLEEAAHILCADPSMIPLGASASTIGDSDIEDDPEDLAEMERRMQEEGYLSSDDDLPLISRPNSLLPSETSDIENYVSEIDEAETASTSTDRSTSSYESKRAKRRRRRKAGGDETPPRHKGDRVAYIHVGEGGEADLEAQLKGADNLDIQILEEENLPDIDETDMIHGLDHTGTSRDYVDETHRCSDACPVGCQGHLRPNEIVIYESFKFRGKLCGRRRYKGRIIYNTRYQESNGGQQQVVAGGGVSGSASQASTSTSSSGATAINGCTAVAGGDSTAVSVSRETRRSTRYARNGSAVNGSTSGYSGDSSEHICNQQRSSSSHHHERTHHRNNYTSSVASSNCSTRSGRSNNSYTSGRSGHNHGGKSARSRRYAAGEGERFERGTHPYSLPSSVPVTGPPSSVHSSSRQQFRDENSSIDSSSVSCSSRTGGRRHHGQRTNNHHSNQSEESLEVATAEAVVDPVSNSENRSERMGGTVASRFKHANRDSSRLGIGGSSTLGGGSTGNTANGKTGSNGHKDFLTDPPRIPPRLEMLLDMPPVPRDIQTKHAWNQDDRSYNIFVKEDDKLTFHRHPVAQSTDCIRSKIGYERGLHVFEITWSTRQRGTHAVVGFSTVEAPVHSVGYQSLVGSNEHSWGWDLGRNKVYHNSKNNPGVTYPANLKHDESFVVPDKFQVVLDMDEGNLGYVVDGTYLGPAFRGLRGKKLYLMISAVWGHCEITSKYLGGMDPEPLPLMDLCRRVIRQHITKDRIAEGKIEDLNLPKTIKDYLAYKDRARQHTGQSNSHSSSLANSNSAVTPSSNSIHNFSTTNSSSNQGNNPQSINLNATENIQAGSNDNSAAGSALDIGEIDANIDSDDETMAEEVNATNVPANSTAQHTSAVIS